jgi:hypothetical protein
LVFFVFIVLIKIYSPFEIQGKGVSPRRPRLCPRDESLTVRPCLPRAERKNTTLAQNYFKKGKQLAIKSDEKRGVFGK